MAGRNGIDRATLWVVISVFLMCLFVAFWGGWTIGAGEPGQWLPNPFRKTFSDDVAPTFREGAPARHEYYGLRAQEKGAQAAVWIVWLTAGTALVSAGGLIAMYRSLRQTRRAMADAREMGEAQIKAAGEANAISVLAIKEQSRPFLMVDMRFDEESYFKWRSGESALIFRYSIVNIGKGPAKIEAVHDFTWKGPRIDWRMKSWGGDYPAIQAGTSIGVPKQQLLREGERTQDFMAINSRLVRSLDDGNATIAQFFDGKAFGWVRVLVVYLGPYGDRYETSAMFRVQFMRHEIAEVGGAEFNYRT